MKIRLAILALLLAIPLLLLVLHRAERARDRAASGARAPGPGAVTPEAPRPAAGDSIPGPDGRLLMAAGDVRAILSGASGAIGAERIADGWRLTARADGAAAGAAIGIVADAAGFDGMVHALVLHARRLIADHPAPDVVTVDAAASAYRLACVTLVVPDPMGLADPVAARALAALAIAEASGGVKLHRARALLAQAMGYTDAAERAASRLAPDDPARTCLLGPSSVLSESAHAPGATIETRMLWLHRLAAVEPHAWEAEADGTDPVLAATGLAIGTRFHAGMHGDTAGGRERETIAARRRNARRAIAAVFDALPARGEPRPDIGLAPPAALAERFEQAMLALPAAIADPFGERAISHTLYPAIFYAALSRLAVPPDTRRAGPAPPVPSRDPYAAAGRSAAFATWCWMQQALEADLGDPTKTRLRIRLLRWFGPPALLALRDTLNARLPEGHPVRRAIERELRLRMDERPLRGVMRPGAAGPS